MVCLNLLIPQPALHDQVDVRKVAFKESKFRLLWHSSDVLLNSELLPSSIDCIPRPHQASSLSDFGHTGLQADAAASLLAESLAPVEWAVCRHVLGVFRAALQEGPTNGLSSAALAALLAGISSLLHAAFITPVDQTTTHHRHSKNISDAHRPCSPDSPGMGYATT